MPVRIPVIEMIEIGAGGGSIAKVDPLGRLTVGPQSAGSEPGPVAFDRGGTRATVTDADAVLGYLDPEEFAEGRFALNTDAASCVIADDIGERLSLSLEDAADGISAIVDEAMASAARAHAAEAGKDLGQRTMIAFGGNGPLHACRVARSAGVDRILVPTNPSIGSAVGFLFAPVSFEIVRSRYALLHALDMAGVNALLSSMIKDAEGVVQMGAPDQELVYERCAFMRYRGQRHEIEIGLPNNDIAASDIKRLTEAFEIAYSKQFSRPVPGMEIEILNWSVSVATKAADIQEPIPAVAQICPSPPKSRRIFCDVTHKWCDAAVVARADLRPGDRLKGPTLVREPQTTTFLAADFSAEVDARGNLIMIRKTS
jgi:N-methylhydantoinase A